MDAPKSYDFFYFRPGIIIFFARKHEKRAWKEQSPQVMKSLFENPTSDVTFLKIRFVTSHLKQSYLWRHFFENPFCDVTS